MFPLVYPFQTQIARADSAVEGILAATDSCQMIATGASVEPLVRKWLFNDVALQAAEKAPCSVLIARRQGARRL